MEGSSRKIDLGKLVSYSDDLARVLRDRKDRNSLSQCLRQSQALRSSCDADSSEVQRSLQDYERKIDECKEKTEAARSEVIGDAELDRLQEELREELERERLLIEDLRSITNQINDLDHRRVSIEEKRRILKKLEQHELRQQMTLSMYASVTKIIPNLEDGSKIGGYIVDRKNSVVDNFEFDSAEMSAYNACSKIWEMIGIS